jgi:DNA-binding transcriptional MerR regulator/methylmalonyl-CoA mutase cobalamin-binding subunit
VVAVCRLLVYDCKMAYPIQVVVRETGLSAHVLRVWEKRYGAVVPQRTATQRRVYSEAQVQRLKLLRQATLQGHPIGSIAGLTEDALEALVKSATVQGPTASSGSNGDEGRSPYLSIIRDCIEAIKAFDAVALKTLFEGASVELGHAALLRHVVAPLAAQLGELWIEGVLRISHEHFATAVIRGFLLNPTRQYAEVSTAATLVVATPQGQLHELGAVIAASLAAELGWRAVYLGPSLPAAEIAAVAIQNQARAVALSIVYPYNDPHLESELHDLRRFLPGNVSLLVGGRAAECYSAALEATGAILIKDILQLEAQLASVRG